MEWSDIIGPLKGEGFFREAMARVSADRERGLTVYPPKAQIFNAFRYTRLDDLKVVIMGQDPYINPGQAMGLAFSVPPGVPVPPSLQNIYKELATDMRGFEIPGHGCLVSWARQGVLLLNATLTVLAGQSNSHHGIGWERFTDGVISAISARTEHKVFLLWGKNAGEKEALIDNHRHLVLKCAHPSPMSASRGFFGCRHFSRANAYLHSWGMLTVDWRLPITAEEAQALL